VRASVDRRIRVLIVRRRLEELAATLVEEATGVRPDQHSRIARRLMLLSARVPAEGWGLAHGVARQAGNVYGATSRVLHSNRAFGDVPEYLVQEWEQIVAAAAAALRDRPPSSPE
jgi:hypothetical protein